MPLTIFFNGLGSLIPVMSDSLIPTSAPIYITQRTYKPPPDRYLYFIQPFLIRPWLPI